MPLILTVKILGQPVDAPIVSEARLELSESLQGLDECPVADAPLARGERGSLTDMVVDPSEILGVMVLARVFQIWLKRDKRRCVEVAQVVDGKAETIVITGENISLQTLESALREAVAAKATEPSGRAIDPR